MGYEYVIYRQRRYICKYCKHTFMEKNSIVKKYESLSLAAKKIIRKLLLKMNVAYTQLARFTSISRQIIMKQQDTIKFKYIDYILPEIISLDEICFQKNTPKTVQYLGKALPPASFALLLVYCLRNIQLLSGNHGLPEFLSLGLTILIHCWKRNMLLSIFSGTVLYMLFQQGILALPF